MNDTQHPVHPSGASAIDTDVLLKAVSASSTTGLPVVLLPGVFKLTRPIALNGSQVLKAAVPGATTLQFQTGIAGPLINVTSTGQDRGSIDGIKIDASGGIGLALTNPARYIVRDVQFSTYLGLGVQLTGGVYAEFERCGFGMIGDKSGGIHAYQHLVASGGEQVHLIFRRCDFYNSNHGTPLRFHNVDSVHFEDCNFERNDGGCTIEFAGCPLVTMQGGMHFEANQGSNIIRLRAFRDGTNDRPTVLHVGQGMQCRFNQAGQQFVELDPKGATSCDIIGSEFYGAAGKVGSGSSNRSYNRLVGGTTWQ